MLYFSNLQLTIILTDNSDKMLISATNATCNFFKKSGY